MSARPEAQAAGTRRSQARPARTTKLSRDAIVNAALTFLDSWNSFLWPLIAVNSPSEMTLPLGLATFQGAHATEWTMLMAGNMMSLVPMLLVFVLAQRYFIRSVAATGLAGT